MARLVFAGADLLPLIEHSKQAKAHKAPYGVGEAKPGLYLVKDDGIYLMSNGEPGLLVEYGKTRNRVVYAKGYEALSGDMDKRSAQYDKIRDAVGGDDFVELVPLSAVERVQAGGQVVIDLTPKSMRIDVLTPPMRVASKQSKRA